MSILGSILDKIFPASAPPTTVTQAPVPMPAPLDGSVPVAAQAAAMAQVDVEAVLNRMAREHPEKLNWKSSIVDLMKLLQLDSSLGARKTLAQELGYKHDTSDSAAMNLWLHRQVMNKLAANGGVVPADLRD